MNCKHIRQKHMVGTQFQNLPYFAFNTHRRFCDHGNFHKIRLLFGKLHFFKFINIPAGTDSTVIRRICQFLCCQIYYKFSRLSEHIIGKTGWSHRNRHHRRIRADSSCPCNCNNIVIPLSVRNTYHNCRKWIKHISCFPGFFFHFLLSSAILSAAISCNRSVRPVQLP